MNAEVQKLVVDKINELRKKNAENQITALATNIVQQLDYAANQSKAADINIEQTRKQIEALNGMLITPLTAEQIFKTPAAK